MVTRERFRQGLTWEQYLDQMTTNKETFLKFYGEAKIRPDDRAALDRLGTKVSCLVLTEDWCGDALYNLPVLAKLVHDNPRVEMRIFLRDKNPDLMDQYLNQGIYRSIPVFAFFDENMNEVARFIERPPKLTEQLEKAMLEVRKKLRAENLEAWRQEVVSEVRSLLKV